MAAALTPDQQAALEQFENDAQKANESHAAKLKADTDLGAAQLGQQQTTAADIADHQAALASAKAFVELMVPSTPEPEKTAPVPPTKAK